MSSFDDKFGDFIEYDNEIVEICPTTKYFQRSINPDNIRDSVENFRKFRENKRNKIIESDTKLGVLNNITGVIGGLFRKQPEKHYSPPPPPKRASSPIPIPKKESSPVRQPPPIASSLPKLKHSASPLKRFTDKLDKCEKFQKPIPLTPIQEPVWKLSRPEPLNIADRNSWDEIKKCDIGEITRKYSEDLEESLSGKSSTELLSPRVSLDSLSISTPTQLRRQTHSYCVKCGNNQEEYSSPFKCIHCSAKGSVYETFHRPDMETSAPQSYAL